MSYAASAIARKSRRPCNQVCKIAAIESLEERTLLSIDIIAADLDPVTTQAANLQIRPDIAISPLGQVVMAWTHQAGTGNTDIRFRTYNAEGFALTPTDRTVRWATTTNQDLARVAISPDGSFFAIAYQHRDISDNPDVWVDTYYADGTFIQSTQLFFLNSAPQYQVDIDISLNGTVVAVWEEGTGGGNKNIRAATFDVNGDVKYGNVDVTSGVGVNEDPRVAIDGSGNFVVTYTRGSNVILRRYNADHTSQGVPYTLRPSSFNHPNDSSGTARVARATDGTFVVTYAAHSGAINDGFGYWHLYSPNGTLIGEGQLDDEAPESLDMDLFGNWVIGHTRVTSTGDYETVATLYNSAGQRGETVKLNQFSNGTQYWASVAMKNNVLAGAYHDATAATVEFSLLEQRRGKIGVARPNAGGGLSFFLDSNSNYIFDGYDAVFDFGLAGDIVIVGDWDGDGEDDLGVGRPNGFGGLTFYLDSYSNRKFDPFLDVYFNFGLEGDTIVVGDWNGDGADDLGVGRSNGRGGLMFFLDSNGSRYFDPPDAVFNFGLLGDSIVVGDWNGDGVDNLGVARANGQGGKIFSLDSNGSWGFDAADVVVNYGLEQDRILVGDWNGDEKDALAIARPNASGGLSISRDVNENFRFDDVDAGWDFHFGLPGDVLVVGAWRPTRPVV